MRFLDEFKQLVWSKLLGIQEIVRKEIMVTISQQKNTDMKVW